MDQERRKCFPCPVLHYKLRATNYILKECAIHGIVSHVEDWYDLKGTERGLGWYSEQATEHAHTAWADVWVNRRFKRDFTHPNYGAQLKAGMATFNCEHE